MTRYRDHYEFCLALMWEEALGARNLAIEESFFRLGGDATSAEAMLASVAAEFDVAVPAEEFAWQPTIDALARLVRFERFAKKARQKPFWIPGKERGPAPLVYLHPVEGDIMYNERIMGFDLGRPVIGIRAVGMDLEEELLRSVDDMAERYIADLTAIGIGEPYVIASVSSSAIIAFAMAQHLEAAGKHVAYLGLLEPPPMRAIPFDFQQLVEMRLTELCEMNALEFDSERLDDCVQALKDAGEIPEYHSFELVMRQAEIFATNAMAGYGYEPRGRFNGHAVLYESNAFGCGPEPTATLAEGTNAYELFWARYLSPQTLVRRQNCDHRGLEMTLATRTFMRDDIDVALGVRKRS